MNYFVHWTQLSLRQLAAAWVAAPDRNAVTAASHRLEQAFAHDPYGTGIPIGSPQNRVAAEPPLAAEYEIVEDDKKVRVLRVWAIL